MSVIRYHKYVGELWDEIDLEALVDQLSEFLLGSGFGQEVEDWGGLDADSLQALNDAILEAALRRGLLLKNVKVPFLYVPALRRTAMASGAGAITVGAPPGAVVPALERTSDGW